MSDIIFPTAFITWTTYGTWLPGDERGWVNLREVQVQKGNPALKLANQKLMNEPAVRLSLSQRELVDKTIREHAKLKHWCLLACNVRTNHVHLVIEASLSGWEVMKQFKSWANRRLRETEPERNRWWTGRGYVRYLEDDDAIEKAVGYTLEGQ
jgi:REP element-mobilizing transposase RayT